MTLIAYSLGANLGDRRAALDRARDLLAAHLGVGLMTSPIYETPALGITDQPPYLNQVVATHLPRMTYVSILSSIRHVEGRMGKQAKHLLPRHIDVDALFYGQKILLSPSLTLPHPRMGVRRFVLQPLSDLSLDWHHPLLGMSIDEMLASCPDQSELQLID